MVALALEVQHGVDEMLEHARPGEGAFLGDVTDEEGRDAPALGQGHQPSSALAHLRDATRRRFEIGQEHRLDRVDDQRAGLHVVEMRLHDRQIVLRPEQEPVGRDAEPVSAHLHLHRGLLGGDVQDRRGSLRQRPGRLEKQRALAHARVAADQHQRAAHHAAAQHPVELADPGADTVVGLHRNLFQGTGPGGSHARAPRRARRDRPLLDELHPAIAGAPAVGTRAGLGAREPAFLAAIDASVACRHPSTSPPCPRGS